MADTTVDRPPPVSPSVPDATCPPDVEMRSRLITGSSVPTTPSTGRADHIRGANELSRLAVGFPTATNVKARDTATPPKLAVARALTNADHPIPPHTSDLNSAAQSFCADVPSRPDTK